MLKILIILLPLFSLSQTLESVFIKQPPKIIGCLMLKEYTLKGRKKNTYDNYAFDEEMSKKNSRATIDVKHLNKNGLILLIENYDSDKNRENLFSK